MLVLGFACGRAAWCSVVIDVDSDAAAQPVSWLFVFRVSGAYLASILACGVLPVWQLVQPSFRDAGVFAQVCDTADVDGGGEENNARDGMGDSCEAQDGLLSSVYLLAANMLMAAAWPIGVFFDIMGPRSGSAC